MLSKIPKHARNVILANYRGVVDVTYPQCAGSHNNVFFVKTSDGTFVTKLNQPDMIEKNVAVARIYNNYNIPVPNITMIHSDNTHAEHYPMVYGHNLEQQISDGTPAHIIKRAHVNILKNFVEMGRIPLEKIPGDLRYTHYYQIIRAEQNLKPFMRMCAGPITYVFNIGPRKDMGLYHRDLNQRNILTDADGNIISILDMDSVSICNRHMAILPLVRSWEMCGFSREELFNLYDQMSDVPLNRRRINTFLSITNMARRYVWNKRVLSQR